MSTINASGAAGAVAGAAGTVPGTSVQSAPGKGKGKGRKGAGGPMFATAAAAVDAVNEYIGYRRKAPRPAVDPGDAAQVKAAAESRAKWDDGCKVRRDRLVTPGNFLDGLTFTLQDNRGNAVKVQGNGAGIVSILRRELFASMGKVARAVVK